MILYRVEAPHYVAGFEVKDGKVYIAAPIISWMEGKPLDAVLDYCRRKGFVVQRVKE